jgi:hypothetical protein
MFVGQSITVRQPIFAQTKFLKGDSLLYAAFFDAKKKRIFADKMDYIKTVDSCVVYIVYDIHGSYHPFTVLEDHQRKRIVETYKRKTNTSWFRNKNSHRDILREDRKHIVTVDTSTTEDPTNPGIFLYTITKYYEITK